MINLKFIKNQNLKKKKTAEMIEKDLTKAKKN